MAFKKVLIVFLVGFALYYLFSKPEDAADVVRSAVGAVIGAFEQVGVFVAELV